MGPGIRTACGPASSAGETGGDLGRGVGWSCWLRGGGGWGGVGGALGALGALGRGRGGMWELRWDCQRGVLGYGGLARGCEDWGRGCWEWGIHRGLGAGVALGSQSDFDMRCRGGCGWGAQVGDAAEGATSDGAGFTPVVMSVWLLAGLVKDLHLSWASCPHGFLFVICLYYVKAKFSQVMLCMFLHVM